MAAGGVERRDGAPVNSVNRTQVLDESGWDCLLWGVYGVSIMEWGVMFGNTDDLCGIPVGCFVLPGCLCT